MSTKSKTVQWTIQKAAGSFSLSSNSVSLDYSHLQTTVTVNRAGNGAIQATSADTNIATVQVSGTNIIISAVDNGSTTISVTVGAGTNHTAVSTAQTINVNASSIYSTTFNDNSWAEIAKATKEGLADTLWNVGDTKDMQFSSSVTMDSGSIPANTTYKAVILGINHNSSKEGNNRLHICIGKNDSGKEICFYGYKMNSSNTNSGGWKSCAMKTWLNGTFYNALPSDLKNVITECTKYTDNTGGGSNSEGNVTATSQKIWLLAEFEVFGSRVYANQYEQNSQAKYDYYKNDHSKVRYGHSGGSTQHWWLRSTSYGGYFCLVTSSGGDDGSNNNNNTCGVVPGFTIS